MASMINAVTNSSYYTNSTSETSDELGQETFLSLLVTQLQNQDPLDPMENDEFVAQMAQFSQLEQMINMNTNLEGMQLLESSINNSQAVNLIGKDITVIGNTIQMSEGAANGVSYDLAEEATEVVMTVYDEDGKVVRTINLGSQSSGTHDFQFDGLDEQGIALEDGTYTFELAAKNADGDSISTVSLCDVLVDGLTFDDGVVYLLAGGSTFLMSDIIEVKGNFD